MTLKYPWMLKSENSMKQIIIAVGFSLLMVGCGSVPKKTHFGQDLAWFCGNKKAVKKTGFAPVNDPSQPEDTCVEMNVDADPYWDFYVREYERDQLPDMPDLP